MIVTSRIRRSFASLSIAVLCAGFVLVGGSGRALARADCLQSDPQADVFITITVLTSTHLHAVVTDAGPCNVPDAVVKFTFPGGTTGLSVTSLPPSWNCAVSGTVATCPSGAAAPTIGVPGNHDFDLLYTAVGSTPDGTITAQVTVGGGPSACTDGNSSTTCDPNPDNNTTWSLVVGAGAAASLTTCPSKPCTQYADMSVPAGGSGGTVQVQQSPFLCPTNFPNSFGKCVSITSGIQNAPGAVTTLILTIDASLAHGGFGGVSVINSTGGSPWQPVANCSKNNPTFPCVFAKTKFNAFDPITSTTRTFIQFVIHKTLDDGWGFDG